MSYPPPAGDSAYPAYPGAPPAFPGAPPAYPGAPPAYPGAGTEAVQSPYQSAAPTPYGDQSSTPTIPDGGDRAAPGAPTGAVAH
jgi:hypothetical protein